MSDATKLVTRRAGPADASALSELCWRSKAHWSYPAEWMEAWRGELTLTPAILTRELVYQAELDGVRAGFVGLRVDEARWHLEHLWVEPSCMGRGVGGQLFALAVRLATASGAENLHIKADPHAETFYLKQGAVRVGTEKYLLLGKHPRELPLLSFALRRTSSGT